MSAHEALPTTQFGKADWVDYTDYWREADAEWMMQRSILRYATAATRATDWGATPTSFGQVTYNDTTDRLEVASKTQNAWATVPQWVNLTSTQDSAAGVSISHKTATSNRGIVFQPTQTVMDNPVLISTGGLTVDGTGLTLKTGAKTAKLTTDATNLVSDSPITATGATLSGPLTGTTATLSGTLTLSGSAGISMGTGSITGGTFTGAVNTSGTVNGGNGTIGGVGLGTVAASMASAPSGVIAQGGLLSGDANSGYLRYRNPSGGALSTSQMTMDATYIRFRVPNGIPVDKADGAFTGAWLGGAIYSATDPGAANFPNGTIWCS